MNCEHICLHDTQYLANGSFSDQYFFPHEKYGSEHLSCSIFVRNRGNDQHTVGAQRIVHLYLYPLLVPYIYHFPFYILCFLNAENCIVVGKIISESSSVKSSLMA